MTDRPLKRGPKGGVYYVARSGARVYVDRSSLPNRVSRLVSINPGDKDYAKLVSQWKALASMGGHASLQPAEASAQPVR